MMWLCLFDISDGRTRYRFEKRLKEKWTRYQKSVFISRGVSCEDVSSLMAYAKGHFRVGDSLVFVPVCESCAEKSEEYGFGSMTWFPEVIIA